MALGPGHGTGPYVNFCDRKFTCMAMFMASLLFLSTIAIWRTLLLSSEHGGEEDHVSEWVEEQSQESHHNGKGLQIHGVQMHDWQRLTSR